jgi:hypothetical protein
MESPPDLQPETGGKISTDYSGWRTKPEGLSPSEPVEKSGFRVSQA